jgi:D-lactate dehydrogenase (cytochrome)
MEMPAGIAASLDRLAAIVGSHASAARGVLDAHGRSEACHESRSPDVVVFPQSTQDVHPSPDLRA